MQIITSIIKLLIFFLITIVLLPIQVIVAFFSKGTAAYVIPKLWHKCVCKIYGIRVHVSGTPYKGSSVFFVGNHVSYLDIPVISSKIPVRFVAKKEVASWPLFGLLAKLQNTYFIDRAPMAAANEQKRLAAAIRHGGRFLIFPEGTSSNGTQVLPFKSAAFSMLFADGVTNKPIIQPFSIVIEAVNGRTPDTAAAFDIYAWHGDMDLAPHLWYLGKQRGVDIALIFHEPFEISDDSDRKSLALICEQQVALPYLNKNYKVAA